MYCTLQEAYNIPAFDPASKRQRGCRKASPQQNTDAFDPYSPITGRELAAAPRQYGREDFTNPTQDAASKVPYTANAADIDYYCTKYGICPKKLPAIRENFEQQQPQCTGPLQPPLYEVPVSDAAKKQYKQAMDTAMSQEQVATNSYAPRPRHVDMDKVSGYVDDDLESYLQTRDFKASPPAKAVEATPRLAQQGGEMTPYDPKEPAFAQYAAPKPTSKVDITGRWMDMLLFVLIGILIIFLCDQLVRMGSMLGMRETTTALMPLIERLEKATADALAASKSLEKA